ncbi:MAG: T9SS type A sorting domain-containing protein [Ignavibacteria bacterium]
MKKFCIILLISNCSFFNISSQSLFQLAIGGAGDDYAYSIKRTTDGGYVAAGGTTSFGAGSGDFYIVKLDASGILQWTKTIGGTGDDEAKFIVQTMDGGYSVAGYTQSFGAGNSDFYIVKLDASGNLQWNRTIGGTNEDVALAIVQTTDGSYVAAGYSYSFGAGDRDYYIVKLDANGNLQWNKTFGGAYYEYGETVIQTTDGGYAMAGFTYSFGAGSGDYYIVKLDASGNFQWNRTIGGTDADYCLSVIQTTDGGYALAGQANSFGAGSNDFYIVKLDANGTLQWTRTVGGAALDYGESIIQTTDGGYVIGGLTYSFGAGNQDVYVVKLDAGGNLQWSRAVGGAYDDYIESIVLATDGGYVGAGHTDSFGAGSFDVYIVKLDASGNTCADTTSPPSQSGTGGTLGTPTTTITIPSPTVTTPSPTTGTGGTATTICNFVGINPMSNNIPEKFSLHQNYPNPFNPSSKIKFQISKLSEVKLIVFDVLGREVNALVNKQLNPGSYEVEWNGTDYSSGVYYYELTAGDYTQTKKMVLLK